MLVNVDLDRVGLDFEASARRASELKDLLEIHDEAFVRRAYQLVLARDADTSGLASYIERLRDGDDRLLILSSLRNSPEGQNASVVFPELDALLTSHAKPSRPLWRRLLGRRGKSGESFRLQQQREINRLRNALARAQVGEALNVDVQPSQNLQALPSRKVTGNVATAARVWSEKPDICRILLLKLDHFGDFFVTVRAFSEIREAWPQAHITLVCGSWNVPFARRLTLFDEILAFDMPLMLHRPLDNCGWIGQCKGISELGLRDYDLAVDLRHDMDTRPSLLFVEARFKAGYESGFLGRWPGGVSPLAISLPQNDLHAELRCTMLGKLVITTLRPPERHPIAALAAPKGSDLPFLAGGYLVVSPSAAAPNRMWPAERFAELLRRIHQVKPLNYVIVGSASDRPVAAAISEALPVGTVADLCGAPFEDMPWIIAHAAAFIGCDSGPGHLAALLGIPTLSIYAGVSPPAIWQPLGPWVSIVHSRTPCAYCSSRECAYDFRCTTEIAVSDVLAEFEALLAAMTHAKNVAMV